MIDSYGSAYAYPSGNKVTVYRNVPATQETKYPANGPFPAKTLESDLDKAVVLIQQILERLDRVVSIEVTEQGRNLVLPPAAVRANGILGFDSAGNVTIVSL